MNKIEDRTILDMFNICFDNKGHIQKRQGYRSFIGLIKMLYQINKSNKKFGCKSKYDIILPVKWI